MSPLVTFPGPPSPPTGRFTSIARARSRPRRGASRASPPPSRSNPRVLLSAHAGVALGSFEFSWHPGEEAVDDLVFFHADDAVEGSAHPHIRLVGGTSGK